MRLLLPLACLILTSGCNQTEPQVDATVSDTATLPIAQTSTPTGPDVRHFSDDEWEAALDAGAGCAYRAPGKPYDSTLFASTSDAIIRVGKKIELLKLVDEGTPGDSTTKLRYENALYRVDVRTVVDSMMEGGAAEHGEMTVEDKTSGGKTMRQIEGGCGC